MIAAFQKKTMKSLGYWKFSHFAYKSPWKTAQLKLRTNLHMGENQPIETAIVAAGSSSWDTAKTFRSGTSKWHPSQSCRCGSTIAEYVDVDYRHLKAQTEHCVSGAARATSWLRPRVLRVPRSSVFRAGRLPAGHVLR